ncbi:LysR family transcriptional regulator [Yoonia sp. GPGPB17]|uniref:LysR family transcriptional regulator n=1 Tax=Yoonia sp. GPGPB17 TaxID=3026147 RepID=UPI0030C409A9
MPNLKLEHLKTFLTVARFKSVNRAAEALSLTQPAVTSRVRSLENSIGTALFDRSGAGMHLTKRGDILLQYAEQFQHLSELVVDASGANRNHQFHRHIPTIPVEQQCTFGDLPGDGALCRSHTGRR